ncbi:MAG: potassium transporter TrkA [Methanomicrobiales archaeon]|nr:potassium transporter TrkA [Methanomicrobiales archaeon]
MPDPLPNGSSQKIKYIILGCGSIGYNVVDELLKETEDILIIDHDEKRVEDLLDQKYEAITRDLKDPALMEGLPVPGVVFVLSNDKEGNLAAVKTIKERYPSTYVIARALDPVSVGLLEQAGADIVLYPQEVIARSAVHHIRKLRSSRMARRLYNLLAGWSGTLGIVTHTNPDPDSISSAMALCAVAKDATDGKITCRIFYDGNIGHQENRAFVNLLDIKMERINAEALAECEHIALVDAPAPGINNALEKDARINVIIDHHHNGDSASNADFVDIRPGLGATASIMTQYLQELDIPVEKNVATALLYGIRADTRDFSRNTNPSDLHFAAFLLPLTDAELLSRITSPSMGQETLDILGNAIRNRKIKNGYLFSNIGYVRNRDAVPQAADLLINLEGVNTALVYGITDAAITLSARNKDIRLHIGNVMHEAFGEIGEAGGHATMAAAIIPLTIFSMVKNKDELLGLVIDPILKKFMKLVGVEDEDTNEI